MTANKQSESCSRCGSPLQRVEVLVLRGPVQDRVSPRMFELVELLYQIDRIVHGEQTLASAVARVENAITACGELVEPLGRALQRSADGFTLASGFQVSSEHLERRLCCEGCDGLVDGDTRLEEPKVAEFCECLEQLANALRQTASVCAGESRQAAAGKLRKCDVPIIRACELAGHPIP